MLAAVLCARADSLYKRFDDLDVYDAERDAFTFNGHLPVIAHPPCRLFGRLRQFAKSENPEREIELGIFCAARVRENGGVLEHPSTSKLWQLANLPRPGECDDRGFTLDVDQYWFGHPAQKRSWLYIAGISPRDIPAVPFKLGQSEYVVRPARNYQGAKIISKKDRERTPHGFILWASELCQQLEAVR